MKIAIIADPVDNQKGGIHVYTRELLSALAVHGRQHQYLVVREKDGPPFGHLEQIVLPNLRTGLGLAALRLFLWVPWVLSRQGVDAVLEPAHFGPFNLPKRIRRITVIHDLTPILFPQYHNWHSQWLQRLFLSGILRRADLVLANSKHTAKDLMTHYPHCIGKVHTLLLGADHLRQRPTEQRSFLDGRGINAPYWLSVGTIEPRKNLPRLLHAYGQFRLRNGVRVLLLIAGQRGWKSDAFFQALEAHPYRQDIHLLGFVPDDALSELYSHALGLVYPSEYEGFGFPVLEAYRCGCPVVCANNSSLPEVGGEWAFYHDAHDADSLCKAMGVLFNLPAEDRAVRCQAVQAWAARFTWEKYVEAFEQILVCNG